MKKSLYMSVSGKNLVISAVAIVVAVAFVFSLDLFYLKTSTVSAEVRDIPTIIVDAGHGGEDGGASSASGIIEKDINLNIALKVKSLFDSFGFKTIMVRNGDYLIYDSSCKTIREKKVSDIHNRMSIIESNPNSIFLSIHQNHYDESKYSGAQVFYSKGSSQSEVIAQCLQTSIVNKLQPDNMRRIKQSGTEIYLLHHAITPAVMVECGFLSNSGEAQLLNDDEYQTKMAMAITDGILNYLNNL
ncbi:MAG: N-acetylmuramoyl-L-alanine amidase [Faecalibacterium sp.]|nr:N-acetylmuramoyl-L-alanine amidase [Ruminococcus sp.]MCM1392804.1 N-acetylmuramoyl-L-alanine amidase [Ruminococcus sp.]MCM1484682.1 N-acetylmuramoyl-L-alanine amidase [Faecalibacterium sp.]